MASRQFVPSKTATILDVLRDDTGPYPKLCAAVTTNTTLAPLTTTKGSYYGSTIHPLQLLFSSI
eukprot:scaffold2570_cov223-Alexandrium_tamarense.AAC.23